MTLNHSEQFFVLHSISIHLFSRFPRKIQLSLYGSTGSSNIFHFISLEKRALFGFLPLQQMVKINEFLFCSRTNMRCVTISYAHYTWPSDHINNNKRLLYISTSSPSFPSSLLLATANEIHSQLLKYISSIAYYLMCAHNIFPFFY